MPRSWHRLSQEPLEHRVRAVQRFLRAALPALVRLRLLAGAEVRGGMPACASCATSVQACLASKGAAVSARNSWSSALSRTTGPLGARSVTVAVAPNRRASACTSASASSTLRPGAKRKFRLRSHRAGTTLRPVKPSMRVTVITSR